METNSFRELVSFDTEPPKSKLTVSTRTSIFESIENRGLRIEARVSSIEYRVSSIEYRVSSIEYRGLRIGDRDTIMTVSFRLETLP